MRPRAIGRVQAVVTKTVSAREIADDQVICRVALRSKSIAGVSERFVILDAAEAAIDAEAGSRRRRGVLATVVCDHAGITEGDASFACHH